MIQVLTAMWYNGTYYNSDSDDYYDEDESIDDAYDDTDYATSCDSVSGESSNKNVCSTLVNSTHVVSYARLFLT